MDVYMYPPVQTAARKSSPKRRTSACNYTKKIYINTVSNETRKGNNRCDASRYYSIASIISFLDKVKYMINKWLYTSKTDDWSTPQDFYDKCNEEFWFEVDVCADDANHKCDRYYTKEDDWLSKDWDNQIVWCNPPYGKEISKRVKKWSEARGWVVVMLLPARTDTRWFHDYVYHKSEIRFIKSRLYFWKWEDRAPFPSMLVIYRDGTNPTM